MFICEFGSWFSSSVSCFCLQAPTFGLAVTIEILSAYLARKVRVPSISLVTLIKVGIN